MKKFLLAFGALCGCTAIALTLVAGNYEEKIRPNTYVGLVPVGGLTKDQAAFKIRQWWEAEKQRELTFGVEGSEKKISGRPGELGLTIDDKASVAEVPLHSFWQNAQHSVTPETDRKEYEVKFKQVEQSFQKIAKFVDAEIGHHTPARVVYRGGRFQRVPERNGVELDVDAMPEVVLAALKSDGSGMLPIKEAAKKVSDEELASITDVMSEFSTRFSTSKSSRTTNIRLAASKIDGLVLAPGEAFSFNGVVGRRTTKAGFRVAGVYRNGKHDIDVGGGICQVSSTLYNAALLANLKIKIRANHSMPVPYVPVGRDATVDYGNVDFAFTNNLEHPIAINTEVNGGTIVFRILGKKDPSLKVKILADGRRSWSTGEKTVSDPTLPAGRRRVIEKGSAGHSVNTYRVVYRDGKEVKREPLGRSYYRGGTRIVAVGTKPAATSTVASGDPQPETPPIDEGDDYDEAIGDY